MSAVNSIRNNLLDGDLCKKIILFQYFLFFWFLIRILSYIFISPMLQLQTQLRMTSQVGLHIEYLTETYNIRVLILYSKLIRNVAALAVFNRPTI